MANCVYNLDEVSTFVEGLSGVLFDPGVQDIFVRVSRKRIEDNGLISGIYKGHYWPECGLVECSNWGEDIDNPHGLYGCNILHPSSFYELLGANLYYWADSEMRNSSGVIVAQVVLVDKVDIRQYWDGAVKFKKGDVLLTTEDPFEILYIIPKLVVPSDKYEYTTLLMRGLLKV